MENLLQNIASGLRKLRQIVSDIKNSIREDEN